MILLGNKETEIKEIEKFKVDKEDIIIVRIKYAPISRIEKIARYLPKIFPKNKILILQHDTVLEKTTDKQLKKLGLKRI